MVVKGLELDALYELLVFSLLSSIYLALLPF